MKQIANIIGFISVIVVNGLANALPINGVTTGEISDSLPTLLTPAGYTFGIWGLIYLGLGAFTVYQSLPSQRNNVLLNRIGYWFALSCLANVAWLLLWHHQFIALSVLAMVILLFSLIVIFTYLGSSTLSNREMWFVKVPFSLYLGWITAAMVLNVGAALVYLEWDGFGFSKTTWMFIMLVVITALTIIITVISGDFVYGGVIIWALVGVIIARGQETNMTNTIAIAIVLIGSTLLIRMVANWRTESGILTITKQP